MTTVKRSLRVYADTNCSGSVSTYVLAAGDYQLANLSSSWNDVASSVKVTW